MQVTGRGRLSWIMGGQNGLSTRKNERTTLPLEVPSGASWGVVPPGLQLDQSVRGC